MKGFKGKKGISLIVLVITIIVMIILAGAIILSLNNSGIIGKANKAKKDSDVSNLKEYINVLEAEWELMSEAERAGKTSLQYVNDRLDKEGYAGALLMEDGTLYTNLQDNAKKALKEGIKIGDTVSEYTLISKNPYPTSGMENTAPDNRELIKGLSQNISQINYNTSWKYIGISENGKILITPDMPDSVSDSQNIKLSGKGGFSNGPAELNIICEALYSTARGKARSMNIEDINRILDYTGVKGYYYSSIESKQVTINELLTIEQLILQKSEPAFSGSVPEVDKSIGDYYVDYYDILSSSGDILKNEKDENRKIKLKSIVYTSVPYWLASQSVLPYFTGKYAQFWIRYVRSDNVGGKIMFYSSNLSRNDSFAIRPVVELNSDVSVSYSNNTLILS